jgi:hypothetical protein
MRRNGEDVYVDIYLYDSLSSGAGYSSGVAPRINDLFHDTGKFLEECDCANSCHKCIKHYRNRFYHNDLDRHAALQLLTWIKTGTVATEIPISQQQEMILPLLDILNYYGIELNFEKEKTIVTEQKRKYMLEIFPSMNIPPQKSGVIYVNDFDIHFARAFAVENIRNALTL